MVAPKKRDREEPNAPDSIGIVFRNHAGDLCLLDFRDMETISVVNDDDDFYTDFDSYSIDIVNVVAEDGLMRSWFTITPENGTTAHNYVVNLFLNPTKLSMFREYTKQAIERIGNGQSLPEVMSFDLPQDDDEN